MTFQPANLPTDAPVQRSRGTPADADHAWSGCDAHNPSRHYRARINGVRAADRVRVHLTWRATTGSRPVEIGAFDFDLPRMLAAGLVREERAGELLACRIVHERGTDRLVIALSGGAPRLVLGTLA